MKRLLIIAALAASGCQTVHPLVEVAHVSHARQHVNKDISFCAPKCGYNAYSAGIRWRPTSGLTVDLLEGYTKEQLHGQKEVFTGRITWEIGAR